MPFSFAVFFRNLFRPRVTSIGVLLYQNGKEITVDKYNHSRQAELTKAIESLWKSGSFKDRQPYWFEVEIYEHRSCFSRRPPTVQVTCYRENDVNPNLKVKNDIPIRYRQKLFDKKHLITPMSSTGIFWSEKIEVKFSNIQQN